MNQFSYYFNGMYFESIATETLFKLIDQNYGNEDNDSECLFFLPRLIFYQKVEKENQNNPNGKEYHGYNEIDCAFILKGKSIEFNEEMITCFNDFKHEDESHFFNLNNFCKLKINQDNVVLLEIKSSWKPLSKKEYDDTKGVEKDNELFKFLKKAKRFINYYIELNLIKQSQNIILIYLYNYSMYYDPKLENKEILKAYDLIKTDKNIKLYIAYFQPYLKLMNSYDRVKKLKTLNQKVISQENEINRQKMEINEQKKEIDFQKKEIDFQKKEIKAHKNIINEQQEEIIRQNEKQKNMEIEIRILKEQQNNWQKIFENFFKKQNEELEKKKIQDYVSFKKEIEEALSNNKTSFSNLPNQVKSSENEKKEDTQKEKEKDSNGKKNSLSSIERTTVDTLKKKDSQSNQ